MEEFQVYTKLLELGFSAFLFEVEWFGFVVRPLDFILFSGMTWLIADLFRLVIMRGLNDD